MPWGKIHFVNIHHMYFRETRISKQTNNVQIDYIFWCFLFYSFYGKKEGGAKVIIIKNS